MSVPRLLRVSLERVGLMLFGLLVGLLLLEVGLRISARFFGPRAISAGVAQELRILTLGDSHTYGVHYSSEESYPGQLQTILDHRAPGGFHVVNLGLPGMNSSEVVARLPEWLLRFQPYAIVVCVGMNNVWNLSDVEEEETTVARWYADLRIMRLASLLRLNLQGESGEADRPPLERVLLKDGQEGVEHRHAETGELLIRHQGNIRGRSVGVEQGRELLRRDLEKIRTLTADSGSQLIVLTYSAFNLPCRKSRFVYQVAMSTEMREFSARHDDVFLIDPYDRFAELLADVGRPRADFFHNETNDHPNPRGYAEIAELVADFFAPES